MSDIVGIYNKIKKIFPNVQQNVPIAPFTAYKIGGNADLYYEVKNIDEIPKLIQFAESNYLSYFLLGGGCNTIFSDKGFRGLLIHNKADKIIVEGDRVTADSGAMLGLVIAEAKKNNLGGIIKLVALPGTIGGAVYGNAGAQGVEIGDFVEKVKLFDNKKGVIEEDNAYFQFSYRTSILKQNAQIVLRVTLKLPPLDPRNATAEVLQFRAQKQPKGKVAGSFFKNPSKDKAAGYLIDKAGLKGTSVGDMEVSQLHGNWLINKGNGTQEDLVKLARKLKEEVKKQFDTELNPENILIDEYGNRIDI